MRVSELIEKKVFFYRLMMSKNGAKLPVEPVDWASKLTQYQLQQSKAAQDEDAERTLPKQGVVFSVHAIEESRVLGIHKPINTAFMTRIGADGQEIIDLMNQAGSEGGLFAHSSSAYFFPFGNFIGIVRGSNSSPGHTSLIELATEIAPLKDKGAHWICEPIMVPGMRKELERADGIDWFTTSFSSHRDLFEPEAAVGPYLYAKLLGEEVGADIEVKLEVRLTSDSNTKAQRRSLKSVLLRALPQLAPAQRKLQARASSGEGSREMLDLIAHRLTASFEVEDSVGESKSFTRLLEHLASVSGAMEDRLKEYL